jgi:hypothetical protein
MNTPIAKMILEMHAAGIPVDMIANAVATLEEAMAARAVSTGNPVDTSMMEKRRAWDRERKRRQRASANSTGHPADSTGIPPDASCIISKKEDVLSIEVKEKKESKRERKNARGTRCPPDFAIDDDDRKFAASLGIPPDIVEAETPQFIDYWSSVSGAKGVKLDWKATWRNRMRDLKKYQPTRRPGNVSAFHQRRTETQEILNDLGNFAAAGGRSNKENTRLLPGNSGERPEGLHGGPDADVIDLPATGYRSSR